MAAVEGYQDEEEETQEDTPRNKGAELHPEIQRGVEGVVPLFNPGHSFTICRISNFEGGLCCVLIGHSKNAEILQDVVIIDVELLRFVGENVLGLQIAVYRVSTSTLAVTFGGRHDRHARAIGDVKRYACANLSYINGNIRSLSYFHEGSSSYSEPLLVIVCQWRKTYLKLTYSRSLQLIKLK